MEYGAVVVLELDFLTFLCEDLSKTILFHIIYILGSERMGGGTDLGLPLHHSTAQHSTVAQLATV